MNLWRSEFRPAARREFKKLPRDLQMRLQGTIDSLTQNPRPPGSKKMAGAEHLWRVRAGDYRIIYQIQDDLLLILIVTLGHRRDVDR